MADSRNEAILEATINDTEYDAEPQSRIEELLLELKAVIESGGGGGEITIDPSLSPTSPNAVRNSAIYAALEGKADTTYVDEKIIEEIGDITTFAYYLCGAGEYDAQGVPTVQNPDTMHIYLTPTDGTNLNMYAYIGGAFTFLGTTEMDMTGYVTEEELAEYVPELPENVSAFTNDAGYITNPRTVLWNYRPPESYEMPVGYIGGAEHVYLYSAEASADTIAALQAAATQQVYLNRTDQPLTAVPVPEAGEVVLAYNLKATETGAEMQVDVDDTSKPFFIVSLGAEEEAASGHVIMVIAGTPPETFDWKIFTEGAYLTEHQSLAAYPQRSELKAVAFSGSYKNLTDKPTIPTVPGNLVTGKNKQGQNTAFTIQLADSAPTSAASNVITIVV